MNNLKESLKSILNFLDKQDVKYRFCHRNRLKEYGKNTAVIFRKPEDEDPIVVKLDEVDVKNCYLGAKNAGGYTVAILEDKFGNRFVGQAICSAEDKYNGDKGAMKALCNALNEKSNGYVLNSVWNEYKKENRRS